MSGPKTCFPFTLLEDLDVELGKQVQKHGLIPSDPFHCACILTEECGEVARAVHDAHYDARYAKASRLDNLREELLQTAVFALRWYEKLKGQRERKIVWLCLACHDESDEKLACHPDEAVRVYEDTIRRGLNASGGRRVFALIVTDEEEPSNE